MPRLSTARPVWVERVSGEIRRFSTPCGQLCGLTTVDHRKVSAAAHSAPELTVSTPPVDTRGTSARSQCSRPLATTDPWGRLAVVHRDRELSTACAPTVAQGSTMVDLRGRRLSPVRTAPMTTTSPPSDPMAPRTGVEITHLIADR